MAGGVKMVAPDGGWGWMVVFGMSLNNLITIPILQNFGLVFRERFTSPPLNFSHKAVNIILMTNSAFGYVLGVLNGPILRNLGFRKVAISGGLMMFLGLFVSSFAYKFYIFFIFYGLVNSLGIGWSMASFHLALSTYFVKRRGMAMGIAMTVTGLGPVFMPLVITYLMSLFGSRGTVLLLSGLVLHCVLCGMLLQPVKWHRKPVSVDGSKSGEKPADEEEAMLDGNEDVNARRDQQILGDNTPLRNGDKEIEMKDLTLTKKNEDSHLEGHADDGTCKQDEKRKKGICQTIVQQFDLDLLKDPAFLSMCVGMSIALASDMSFSLLLPFILGDYKFDTQATANIQVVVGAADILSRFFSPFIVRTTRLSARVAYLISIFGVIVSRFCLTLTSQFYEVAIIMAFFGASKGVRSVFMPLVIPNYVPLEKLPSAQGLQNVMNGLFLMMMGPLIGYIRDKTGNYYLCIHIMNSLSTLLIILWTIEFVWMKSLKKNTFVDQADAER